MPPSGGFFCAFCDQSKLALGWRKKKLSVKVFSTTGAVLLFCKQAAARRGKSYKTSDRSELATACKAELMSQTRCRWFESVCPDQYKKIKTDTF